MAKNFVHEGRRVVVPAPSGGVTSGQLVVVGALWGVALTTAAVGASVTLAVGGVWTLPKASGAVTQGQALYWDATSKVVTTTAGSNQKIGVAEQAAASGDAELPVRLNTSF